ncbi:site-specific DNA-methyltransferase [Anaerococcus sp. AGMB09787]|uniref:DNA-methyltransferase n=1 Tax=Anaerococcus sp. AGMB09787 TaxID=2922869 RepID=UPI001FAF2F34|nr:site-specific DNA-methyltransferase [Anaerococcus sp. AGMB09787]
MEKLDKKTVIFNQDAFTVLPKIKSDSIDLIVTDPPYFLSNDGITCKSGKVSSVNKGDWDKAKIPVETFYFEFLKESKRILKPNGSIWVFGTMHNIYYIGYLMNKLKFKILNNITWQKTNPAPNLSCRMFTHSTETILWAKKSSKSKHYFNYELMKELNNGKQMKDVRTTSTVSKKEKRFGYHPTQKPISIIERIVLASSAENDLVLDCFMGSGTTLEACIKLDRRAIGIEKEKEFYDIAKNRLIFTINNKYN